MERNDLWLNVKGNCIFFTRKKIVNLDWNNWALN